jgi:leader peptidase (prepilin peptidase)/N-methyltransferase
MLVSWGYSALRGRPGLGGGDVKLLAAIGAVLGWQGVLPTILIGSITGLLVGLPLVLFKARDLADPLPFGPFLSLGALAALVLKLVGGYPGV